MLTGGKITTKGEMAHKWPSWWFIILLR